MTSKVLEFRIHDLYLEFAEEEVQTLESRGQTNRILYDFGGVCLPSKLWREWECRDLKRMGIYESEVKSIKRDVLVHCSQVEVLQVYKCKNLKEFDVEGMDGLQILDVVWGVKRSAKFQEVNKLKDPRDLSSLTALQFLELCNGEGHFLHPPYLSGCCNLRKLIIECLESFPNLGNLTTLEKFECHGCLKMESTIGLNSLTNLKVLDLFNCFSLVVLLGLCNLGALETFDVACTRISELHGIGKLQHLQKLDVIGCENLTSLVELEYMTSLRCLHAYSCYYLKELPSMSNLKRLEVVDLSVSEISVIPSRFGRLARNCIFNLGRCEKLLEPLELWLWKQELLSMEGLSDNIFLGLLYIEEIEDELRSNIRKDVTYYMDQASSNPFDNYGLASERNSLGEEEGGIEYAINALCEHEDLGILSLVVAKYLAEVIVKIAIPKLSSCIIEFLNLQLNHSFNECDFDIDTSDGHLAFWCILFILEQVIKNDMLVKSLEAINIELVIKKFVMNNNHDFE